MAILGPPLGKILSFGSANAVASAGDRLYFSGTVTDISSHADNSPPRWKVTTLPARDTIAHQDFPVSKTGLGPRPLQVPVISWDYWIQTTAALNQAASWADLEARVRQIQNWWRGTYSFTTEDGSTTYAGMSGQLGDLVVLDAHGAPRRCRAEWVHLPDDIPIGQVSFYDCELQFRMFEHWSNVVGVIYDTGYIYDTGVIYG